MHFTKNRILVAILALGLPMVSSAQTANVVPPPAAPGATENAQVRPGPAPTVLPPTSTNSVNPAAAVQGAAPMAPPPLIDIALPAAPKPAALSDLKPAAPKQSVKRSAKPKAAKVQDAVARVTAPADPFAGIIGTPVSDSQLNRFVFPEAVEGIFFQEGAPLPECPEDASEMDPCKPVFLNGKRVMLLQLRAGAKGPVQMVVHLKSGKFTTMNLMPSAGPGAVIRVDGADDGASDARLAEAKSKAGVGGIAKATGMTVSEQNTETLARLARGDIPAGFEPVAVDGKPIRFELFEVTQRASWDNGAGLRLHLMQVAAHDSTPVVISPALFRKENIKALALDRETITNAEPALLYMLEHVPTENN